VWSKHHEDAATAKCAREKQVKVVEERRERLVATFVYQQAIDEETYRRELRRLDDEMAFVLADWVDSTMEEAELKGLLNFAEHVLENPDQAWSEFALGQQQRFQKIVFPEGLTCERSGRIGTAVTSPVFRFLSSIPDEKTVWWPQRDSNPCRGLESKPGGASDRLSPIRPPSSK